MTEVLKVNRMDRMRREESSQEDEDKIFFQLLEAKFVKLTREERDIKQGEILELFRARPRID